MLQQERINLLEEIMDVEPGSLHLEDVLDDFEEWDSLSILTYITTLNEKFKKTIDGKQIKAFVTVEDAIKLME